MLLSRDLANRGHFPAIDVLGSLSRLMPRLVDAEQMRAAAHLRELLAVWAEGRDLVEIGAYKPGTNPRLDEALRLRPALELLLRQDGLETTTLPETRALLASICQHLQQEPS